MRTLFVNILSFSLLYFTVVLLDLLAMYIVDLEMIRFITKPLLIVLLIVFYASNDKESTSGKFVFLIIALGFFLLANVATLFRTEPMVIMSASIFFILGKLFYIFRFANRRDFDIVKFLPFVAFYLLYMFVVLSFILDHLGSYLIPVMLFLFVSLMAMQFAFLRKDEVSEASYQLVLFGIFTMLFGDTIQVLDAFYFHWTYGSLSAMLLYAMSQYLIVMGLVKEKIDLKSLSSE